jgi:heat shock protein HslJ
LDGSFGGQACNHYGGRYRIENGRIVTNDVAGTLMSCGQELDAIERRLFQILAVRPAYRLGADGALLLGDSEPAVLRAVPR